MKNLVFTLLVVLPCLLVAQTEGTIQFQEVRKLEIQFDDDMGIDKEQLAKMMPNELKEKYVLFFNEKETLYKTAPEEKIEDEVSEFGSEDEGFKIKVVRASSESALYHNLAKNSFVEQKDFMGKTFLIKDAAQKYAWKLTGETKEILGYTCTKATLEEDEKMMEAWFTSAIPVASGPSGYYQLPGMILEFLSTKGKSETHIIATDIQLDKLEKGLLVAPKKGKEVTQAEFEKTVEERTREMHESMGGKGSIKIKSF